MILRTTLFCMSLGLAGLLYVASADATQVSREADITNLRLGERILVDDGSCPAGQIKEISGAKLGPTGVIRARKCISRTGPKR
jgi:uncharacterized protein DUF6719